MAKVIETEKAKFAEKYPGGQITMSVPIDQARKYLPELQEQQNRRDRFVVHTIYLGKADRLGDRAEWHDDAYPYYTSHGKISTREDYEATLKHNRVPLPADNYEKVGELWVANRRLQITVSAPTDEERKNERKLSLKRVSERPNGMEYVKTGVKMVETLVDHYGLDVHDVKPLVIPDNIRPGFSNVETLRAEGSDRTESITNIPEDYPRRIIRGVIFRQN